MWLSCEVPSLSFSFMVIINKLLQLGMCQDLVFAIPKYFDIYRIHKCVSPKHNNLFHIH